MIEHSIERFETVRALHACKMEKTGNVSTHFLKMQSHLDQLEILGSPYPLDLATDLILNSLPKARQDKKKKQGKNSKGKPQAGKGKGKKDPQNPPPKKKKNVAKYNTCFECGFVGHWKRNSPKYLVELKNKKFWDGISRVSKKTRELKTDEMLLHVGNGAHDLNETSNENSLYHVNTIRIKQGLNQRYLWHCRRRHINKRLISQLQKSGLLGENESESFDIFESYLCGKMTKSPFCGTSERASVLLGITHIDVCGPFKTMSRYGERSYMTLTNDFSRFGYMYLMKHKHEAFDNFKLFQSEFESQLDKAVKVLRSYRGGE
uniref:GAG-pre-integrase domain-containing protein n=1 Tax=Lactuca sativa TaxID=4236 RepID=A0A9R1VHV4_LACSA|nr:hypothetical protein LSAT_V11C500246130 [Lactuca sativa]